MLLLIKKVGLSNVVFVWETFITISCFIGLISSTYSEDEPKRPISRILQQAVCFGRTETVKK